MKTYIITYCLFFILIFNSLLWSGRQINFCHKITSIYSLPEKFRVGSIKHGFVLFKTEDDLSKERQKNERNFFLIGIGLISILSLVLFYLYDRRQKNHIKLQELDAFKTKMFTNLSHEFRTPLTVIQGLSKNLELSITNPSDRKTLQIIYKNAELLNEQLKQIIAISSLDQNEVSFRWVRQNIVEYLHSLCELFKGYAKSKDQRLTFFCSEKEIFMDFDPDKIQIIVQNLISNALKFNSKNGEIKVRVKRKNNRLLFFVGDQGIGISPKQQKLIFNRFYTTSTENNLDGTGIGLAYVKEIVEKMKGTVKVKSKIGKGTIFKVSLPLNQSVKVQTIMVKPKLPFVYEQTKKSFLKKGDERIKPIKGNKKILIVEDNIDIQFFFKQALGQEFNIIQAFNGVKALKLLDQNNIDLVITDLSMPKMDGFEFSKKIKTNFNTSHIPIIVISAHNDLPPKQHAYQLGIDAYLTKPFKEAELRSIIDNLIIKQEQKNKFFAQLMDIKSINENQIVNQHEINFIKNLQEIAVENKIFTTEQIAFKLGMSRSKLNHKVKTLTGKGTASYIKSIKIKKAKKLLQNTNLLVSEIGFTLGYDDASLFAKVFKSVTKQSPKQFRENHSNNL